MVGYASGTILNCSTSVDLSCTASNDDSIKVGGLAGGAGYLKATSCTAEGTISTNGNATAYIGELYGSISLGSSIISCATNCSITSTASQAVIGGVVGYSEGNITISKTSVLSSNSNLNGVFLGGTSTDLGKLSIANCTYNQVYADLGTSLYPSFSDLINVTKSNVTAIAPTYLTMDTVFYDLGVTKQDDLIVTYHNGINNQIGYVTLRCDNTLQDLADNADFKAAGLGLTIENGVITFTTTNPNSYITDIDSDLAKALKIKVGENYTYTTEYINPDSKALGTCSINTINENTTLGELGLSETSYITLSDGNIITITPDTTVSDLCSELQSNGIQATITDGKLSIDNTGSNHIENMPQNLADLFKIDTSDLYSSQVISLYKNSDSNSLSYQTVISTLSESSTLDSLGISGITIRNSNNGTAVGSVDLNTIKTIAQLKDYLKNQFNIDSSLVETDEGTFFQYNSDLYTLDIAGLSLSTSGTYGCNSEGLEYDAQPSIRVAATLDTLLSEFDNGVLAAQGSLLVLQDGTENVINISDSETIGSFIEKLKSIGLDAKLENGILSIAKYGELEITAGTSNVPATLNLTKSVQEVGAISDESVIANVSSVSENEISVAKYVDYNSKLKDSNITDGTFTIFENGKKSVIQIDSEKTFGELNSQIASTISDARLVIKEGRLVITSNSNSVINVGTTTDTSNITAVAGLTNQDSSSVEGSRVLYKVNNDSIITQLGLFNRGDVTVGNFTIGDEIFTIDSTTTVSNLISQINNSEKAYASAYWDSVDGKFVITSKLTGSSLINIESGTSNFTDIMGYTETERSADNSIKSTKLNTNTQKLGKNAKFTINGTNYTAASNTVASDITRIKGVTLNLKNISEDGGITTITVDNDSSQLADAVSDIVDGYNNLMENVDEQLSGDLKSESTLRLIRNQLKNYMTSSIQSAGVFKNLESIGISVSSASAGNISTSTKDVIDLQFDSEKFINAFEEDSTSLKNLLVGTDDNLGIFTKVENLIESSLKSVNGYFDLATNSLQTKADNLTNRITRATQSVEAYRARLEKKFNTMDMLISNIQNQYSSFLST
jgi:flagellar capping protein FliD